MKLQTDDVATKSGIFQFYTTARTLDGAKEIRRRWMDRGHETIVRAGSDTLKGKILIFVKNLR